MVPNHLHRVIQIFFLAVFTIAYSLEPVRKPFLWRTTDLLAVVVGANGPSVPLHRRILTRCGAESNRVPAGRQHRVLGILQSGPLYDGQRAAKVPLPARL